jgi:hypothetical protein
MCQRAAARFLAMALGVLGPIDGATAQQLSLSCDSFVKNDDGPGTRTFQ